MQLYTHDVLLNNMLSADFNANDFFEYSTACCVTITQEDFPWVEKYISKYNQDGFDACLAYIQNRKPLPKYVTEEFKAAINELMITKQRVSGDIDHQVYYYDSDGPYRKIEKI